MPLEYLTAFVLSVAVISAAAATTLHVILHKSDVRAAAGWIGLVWFSPIIGAVLYVLMGVNRIRRKATELRRTVHAYDETDESAVVPPEWILERLPDHPHLVALARVGETNVGRPLVAGNRVEAFHTGDEAYDAMLEAIAASTTSITLLTYIFDNDPTGREFADALRAAVKRGVEVRVLIDAAGARYSFPSIVSVLRAADVPVARFLPSSLIPPYILSVNLRNHRKIMVVDGRVAFTGGMNIRDACRLKRESGFPTRDLHFRVTGPVVLQLQQVFAEDWTFSTKENLSGETWFRHSEPVGDVIARGIPDGPDVDLDKLRWALLGAIGCATESIRIVTPYFLPDDAIVDALTLAAMRGVRVQVVMPEKNNLPFVAWACAGQLRPLLQFGVDVRFVGGDFDHSKVCVVDRAWTLVGSPNWDPRSLRLNFEFALECFDGDLATALSDWIDERCESVQPWTVADHDGRRPLAKLRDAIFRLGAPYL